MQGVCVHRVALLVIHLSVFPVLGYLGGLHLYCVTTVTPSAPFVCGLQKGGNTQPAQLCSKTHRAFLLLQPPATFHSVQSMSDTKADVSCEIPV